MPEQTSYRSEYTGSPIDDFTFPMGLDVGKYFIETGRSFLDLLMRCNFRGDRERKAMCQLAEYCLEYELEKELVNLTMLVASSDSVNAARIERFLAAVTGGASRNGKDAGKENSIFNLTKYTKPQVNTDGNFNT